MKRLAYAILLALLAATTTLGQDRFVDTGGVRTSWQPPPTEVIRRHIAR